MDELNLDSVAGSKRCMDAELAAEAKEASGNDRLQYEYDYQPPLEPLLSGSDIYPDEAEESHVLDSTITEDKANSANHQNALGVFEDPSLNCASKKPECAFSLESCPGFQDSLELVFVTQERQQETDMGLKPYQVQAVEEGENTSTLSISEREGGNLNEQVSKCRSSHVEVDNRRTAKGLEDLIDMNLEVSHKLPNSDVTVGTCAKSLQKMTRKSDVVETADGNGGGGSLKCSLKIEVIDGTALIELPQIANYGNSKKNCVDLQHEAKRLRAGRNYQKIEAPGKCERAEKFCKITYTKKDMEVLRFLNVKEQKKLWQQVYNGLEPSVRKEYTELGSFRQQKNGHFNSRHAAAKNNSNSVVGQFSPQGVNSDVAMSSMYIPNDNGGGDGGDHANEDWSDDEDSDDDYVSIQRPAFLVEGEPNFDSGPPEDGFEYLRRVRWEAAQIPKVKVANLDKKKISKDQSDYMPKIPDIDKCPEYFVPLKQWEDEFLADFSKLRLALSHLEESRDPGTPKLEPVYMGQLNFRAPGKTSVGKADHFSSLQLSSDVPTLSVLLSMDPVKRINMLRKRISLFEGKTDLSRNDCEWIFALCALVETPLDADTCAALRSLLRKCARLRAGKRELDDEVVMLNVLATISGKYFGQLES